MTSKDFAYWLQGFFELSETDELTPRQVEIIKNHLKGNASDTRWNTSDSITAEKNKK
jgi:hypothetical protein